jgi:hypothetical protein
MNHFLLLGIKVLVGPDKHLGTDGSNVINRGTTKDDWFDCKVNLITAPDSVVDIEQPSFASPQHIVAFVIDVALDAKGNDYKEGMKVVVGGGGGGGGR